MTSNSELREMVKHLTFMKMTEQLAKGVSYDPKHQVGALIVKNDWTKIEAMGYNGAYKGSPNKRFSLDTGNSKFIHAEMNAIAFSTLSQSKAKKYTMFVTLTPCEICSRLIVNKGIKNVVVLNKYNHCGDSLEVFKNADVKFNYIHDLLADMYKKTSLVSDPLEIIDRNLSNELLNTSSLADTIILSKIDEELIKCFKEQLGLFFEFNKSPIENISVKLSHKNFFREYKSEEILNYYIKEFVKTLYDLL
jgi:dCMP deaminase